jgi:hypothetical protein
MANQHALVCIVGKSDTWLAAAHFSDKPVIRPPDYIMVDRTRRPTMRAPYAKCSIFARMASALLIVVLPSTLTASVANPDGLTFSSTPTEWTDKLPDLTPPLRVAAWAREQLAKLEELAGRLQPTLRRPRLENRSYP